MLRMTYLLARRIVIAVVGTTTVLIGVVMLVTPGPGLLVIPAGLAILGLEFAWARHWLGKLRRRISDRGRADRERRAESHLERARPRDDTADLEQGREKNGSRRA